MRLLLQRVSFASVEIDGKVHASIKKGLLVLAGITDSDDETTLQKMAQKLCKLRIFNDADGKMNLSVMDISGDLLIVSQFTLYADAAKGNRPSYITAARPEIAIPLYERFLQICSEVMGKPVQSGVFGADMKVSLLNDGPVSIWLDSVTM